MSAEETPFDPIEYWTNRGKGYIHEKRLREPFYVEQENFIVKTIQAMQPRSILEIGCGYGRVTKRIAEALPNAHIIGLDVSRHQIKAAREYYDSPNKVAFLQSDVNQQLPAGIQFDLVLAVEVLLHIPPKELKSLIKRILDIAPVFVHDFDQEHKFPLSPHVFAHNYAAIYAEMGLECGVLSSGPYSLMVVGR